MKRVGLRILMVVCLFGAAPGMASDDDKQPIRFAMPLDFTAVYTFFTDELHQGMTDYITLVNETGGVDGHLIETMVRDHGNEPQRGIEAYNRARRDGAVMGIFGSTPVTNAIIPRAMDDEVVIVGGGAGRGDASDGQTFPFAFPALATYWSQAAALMQYVDEHHGGLEGKRIAHVHIDTPFGREPIAMLEQLAEREGFDLRTFAYPPPGSEQSGVWSDVRRYQPDFVTLWGAGGGQAVSAREAIRNGIAPEQLLSVLFFAETDARTAGAERVVGLRRAEATFVGTDTPTIRKIQESVVEPGLGEGDPELVGTTYYNLGVAIMATVVEGARLGLEQHDAPLTGPGLRDGLRSIKDFTAEGLLPPLTFSEADHQGGGYVRISEWNGETWEPVTDWFAAYQDLVWEQIEVDAAEFRDNQ